MENSNISRTAVKIFFITFTVAILYLNIKGINHVSDDLVFSREASQVGVIEWLISRYNTWSSRTSIEFALINVINHKVAWSFLNSIFIGLTLSCVSYLISSNSRQSIISSLLFLVALLFALKKGFLKDGVLWMTGSVNYLWPVALALLGFSLIKYLLSHEPKALLLIVTPIVFFLSSFSEQIVVVNLIILSSIAVMQGGVVRKISIISLVAALVVLIYILMSPGNELRFQLEIPRWNLDFVNLNIVSKIILGVNLSFDQLFVIQPVALIIMYISLFFISPNLKSKSLSIVLLMIVLSVVIFNRFIPLVPDHTAVRQFNSSNVTGAISILRFAIVIVISALTTITIYLAVNNRRISLLIAIFYVTSFSGTVMLGLSPTLYASGERIFFVSGVMVAALAAYFATQAISQKSKQKQPQE
jgi:hypothetical protein